MKYTKALSVSLLAGSIVALCTGGTTAWAKAKNITLMQLQDMHGHMHAHAEIFPDGRKDPYSGGLAKMTTLINQVRDEVGVENSLLLAIGDTTHGSTETTFSLGDSMMPWLNSLGIDAFAPGNWDFGYGPRVYKQRFVPIPANVDADTPPTKAFWLAPNNRTTIAWMDGMTGPVEAYSFGREDQHCNRPGAIVVNYTDCHVTHANFDTIAINLYNYNEAAGAANPAQPLGAPVHPGFVVKPAGDLLVGIIGITSDVVPQQAQAFNTSFRFTMGYKELPGAIAAAKTQGADLIVVLSELGLAKNVQLVKEFPEIDVMFSGHTHERTPQAIVIDHGNRISLVTEAGEDSFLGRLDLKISDSKIQDWAWNLMESDSGVEEDADVEAYVDYFRSDFEGPDAKCHTFGTNAFPFGKGHTICDPLDTPIGYTEVTIQRWNALEDISNNAMTDAVLDLALSLGQMDSKDRPLSEANTLSTTNGFRFDVVILGDGEPLVDKRTGPEHMDEGTGIITLEDLYDYYPIGAATALAEYTGGRLKLHWEGILNNVFDPNPYRQRGGWFLGFTHNMHFDIHLSDDYPLSISAGKRIAKVTIDDGMGTRPATCMGTPCAGVNWDQGNPRKIDDSEIYTLASCYPHGNPIDEVCRTAGATNLRFITAPQATAGSAHCPHPAVFNAPGGGTTSVCQLDMSGPFNVVPPENSEDIWDPVRFAPANGGPLFLKVAPDNFVHPVDALRRYLPSHNITTASHGLGRVSVVGADPADPRRGVPVSAEGGAGIVQPTQGAGPSWEARGEVLN